MFYPGGPSQDQLMGLHLSPERKERYATSSAR
jgi:hypothetical protein